MFLRETDPGLGRSGRARPQLETLEDRCCPSGVTFHSHLLTLNGDSSNTTMVVRDDGHGDVKVTLDSRTTSYAGVQQIVVNSKTGADRIDYALTGKLTTSELMTLNLGNGDDLVKLDYTKGVSAASLKVNVNGDNGDQNVTALYGPVTDTNVQVNANLGGGFDHFTAFVNGGLSGKAHVDFNIKGGSGIEGVNIVDRGAIGPSAKLSVEEALGSNNHSSHVDYTGKLSGQLSVNVQGGPAWDWLESTINLTPGSTGSVYDHELGGAGSDMLQLMIYNAGSRLKSLDALIDGQGGVNTAVHTSNVRVLNAR